jgi:hypothetical protein
MTTLSGDIPIPCGSEDFGDPRRAMTDDELQTLCLSLGFEVDDDYTEDVIRAVERRMLGQQLIFPTPDHWRQYANDGETAQACIERHRAIIAALTKAVITKGFKA